MNDLDSLRLELEAERHNHRKDNEHFMAKLERLQALLQTCVTALDSKEMQATWAYLYAHGYKYAGPIIPMNELRSALEQARKELASLRGIQS